MNRHLRVHKLLGESCFLAQLLTPFQVAYSLQIKLALLVEAVIDLTRSRRRCQLFLLLLLSEFLFPLRWLLAFNIGCQILQIYLQGYSLTLLLTSLKVTVLFLGRGRAIRVVESWRRPVLASLAFDHWQFGSLVPREC